MEIKGYAVVLTAVTVAVIVFAATIPIFQAVGASEDTFFNDGVYYMHQIDSTADEITISYTKSPYSIKYNDEDIDVSKLNPQKQYTMASAGTDWVIRMTNNPYVGIQGIGYGFTFGGINTDWTRATISNGTISITTHREGDPETTVSTITKAYTDMWIYSPNPTAQVMKSYTDKALVNSTSEFIGIGATPVSVWNDIVKIEGTIDNYNVDIIYPPGVTTTLANPTAVYDTVSGYNDLYNLEKLTFTISDGTSTVDATYSAFIVPACVSAERSAHADSATATMFNLMPLIIIAGLVIMAVAVFVRRS